MNPTTTILFPAGNQAQVENARALILLCQDRDENYVVAWGARNELQKLLVWGSRNWWIMIPPGEDYFQAVAEIEARIVQNDSTPLDIASPSCQNTSAGRQGGRAQSGITCVVNWPGRNIRLTGISDFLLFAVDEHGVKLRATGGSGIEKHFLIETGIATLFGKDTLTKFSRTTLGSAPAGTRDLLEQMRRQMRKNPDQDFIMSRETADALAKKSGKN